MQMKPHRSVIAEIPSAHPMISASVNDPFRDQHDCDWQRPLRNLRDADAALLNLYQSCVDAGPAVCPLYGNSTYEVADRVNRMIETLAREPKPWYLPVPNFYGLIEAIDIKLSIFGTLYNVHTVGRFLFNFLAELETNTTSRFHASMRPAMGSVLKCDCSGSPSTPLGFAREASLAIACGDGEEVISGVGELREHYEHMASNYSAQFAYLWSLRAECS